MTTHPNAPAIVGARATLGAIGEYYMHQLTNNRRDGWAIIAPEGTTHGTTYDYREGIAECLRLNAEDRAVRSMTDADKLAAIRAALDGYKLPSSNVLIKDTRDILIRILDILAADQPAPEPLVDTLPPGPVVCPHCGESCWFKSTSAWACAPLIPQEGGTYTVGPYNLDDIDPKADSWLWCGNCGDVDAATEEAIDERIVS